MDIAFPWRRSRISSINSLRREHSYCANTSPTLYNWCRRCRRDTWLYFSNAARYKKMWAGCEMPQRYVVRLQRDCCTAHSNLATNGKRWEQVCLKISGASFLQLLLTIVLRHLFPDSSFAVCQSEDWRWLHTILIVWSVNLSATPESLIVHLALFICIYLNTLFIYYWNI